MVRFFKEWYQRKFSDPHAVTLVVILFTAFLAIYFLSGLLMPVFVAIAIAFLLDLPVNRLKSVGVGHGWSVTFVVSAFVGLSLVTILGLMPVVWQQGTNLLQEVPHMFTEVKSYLMTLPEKYPDIVQAEQIEHIIGLTNDKLLEWGQVAIEATLNSLSDMVALIIYLILVPIMIFFFLKDKQELVAGFSRFLPKERRMASQVGKEMNQQILNYIRGKLIEILIIGAASTITFIFLDLRYSVLLGVLVGLSVLVPYVGATLVTFPVLLVALFQFGVSPELGYVMLAYGIIQALDGNLLVPLLFSEAVNLHPVTIIIAVILFGGLWGFWGVFFAIPLATLVKAVVNAWPTTQDEQTVTAT
ncbi:AI-2E family transporter [Thalassotalea sp. M1531]|uniref:AI-2E family transporter n=1 Tax=Thalassotalea algicola TaxID=2716224 RepID=A0A7Y0Q7J9_9GAMM|nr:AI-2E family transporter [Thalassotalea algicola]NMP32478.1 AI-2E family transporter [Thalassotalea algicola]